MPTSQELRTERAGLITKAREIYNKAEGENKRSLTGEESQEFDRLMNAAEELRGKITEAERVESLESAEAELRNSQGRRTQSPQPGTPGRADRVTPEDVRESIRAWALQGTDRAIVGPDVSERAARAGVSLHSSSLSLRALAKGAAGTGGDAVPRGMAAEIEKAQKWYNPIIGLARMIRTDSGADLDYPRVNDTANAATIVDEAGAIATNVDASFDKVTFKAFKYATPTVLVSVELLQDMVVDPEQLLGELLGERMGRGRAAHLVNGNGTTQPQGLAVGAPVAVELASGNALSFDKVIDLIYSVDRAYRMGASFMVHDATVGALSKLKDGENRYLWEPGLQVGDPDRLRGYPVEFSNDLEPWASDIDETDKIMLFGAMGRYGVREVTSSMEVIKLRELYAATGQVGFVLLQRSDGRYIGHSGCVKALAGFDAG